MPSLPIGCGVALLLLMGSHAVADDLAKDAPIGPYANGQSTFTIFAYHRFGEQRYPSTNISIDVFAAQLAFLKQHGFTVLSLGQALEGLHTPAGLPDKTAVLTVDDGYQSFLTGAMPLLRQHDYPATLFINTDQVGKPGFLDWPALISLVAEGVEMGNHSASHTHFLNLDSDRRLARFHADLEQAQAAIARHLGESSRLFSYPYGEYDLAMQKALQGAGFTAATAQNSGAVHRGSDMFALPRFPMGGPYATLDGFSQKIGMKPLPLIGQKPRSPVLGPTNPPELRLTLGNGLNLRGLQFFVQGTPQAGFKPDPADPGTLVLKADSPLRNRRTLYTVTAPSLDGQYWHWFSHMWIRPEIPE